MSNLTLPKLTASNLHKLVKRNGERKLAYATTAERIWNDSEAEYNYIIRHHSNAIAVIGCDSVKMTHCGYNTVTTANRLNRILIDNEIPFAAHIKQYEMVLSRRVNGTLDRVASFDAMGQIRFTRTTSSWILT